MRSGPQKMPEWMSEWSPFYVRNHKGEDTSNLFLYPQHAQGGLRKCLKRNQVRDLRGLTVFIESWYNHEQVPSILNLYFLICKSEVVIPPKLKWGGKKVKSIKRLANSKALHRCQFSPGLFTRTLWQARPKDVGPDRSSILGFGWPTISPINKLSCWVRGHKNSRTDLSRRWSSILGNKENKTWSRWGGEDKAPTESLPAALNHLPSSDSWSPLASISHLSLVTPTLGHCFSLPGCRAAPAEGILASVASSQDCWGCMRPLDVGGGWDITGASLTTQRPHWLASLWWVLHGSSQACEAVKLTGWVMLTTLGGREAFFDD